MYIQLMDNNEDTNVYDMLMWRVSLVFSKTCQRCAKNDALIYSSQHYETYFFQKKIHLIFKRLYISHFS